MSISLDIMTEKIFNIFIKEYNILDVEPLGNKIVLMEKYSEYYTNFSGKIHRLYDIILEGEQIVNDFSKEEKFLIYKLSKKQIINLVNKSDDNELIDKWEPIIESFESLNDDDDLYFIIDK